MTYVISFVKHISRYEWGVLKDEFRKAVVSNVVQLLREVREERGVSMNVLAQRAGLSQSSISLIENHLRIPNLDTLLRLAEVLEINLGGVIDKAIRQASKSKRN